MEFFIAQAKGQFDLDSVTGKQQMAEYIFEPLAAVPNRIERSHWLQKIAGVLKVPEQSVTDDFDRYLAKRAREQRRSFSSIRNEQGGGQAGQGGQPGSGADSANRQPRTFQAESEQNVVAIVLHRPELARQISKAFNTATITRQELRDIFEQACAVLERNKVKFDKSDSKTGAGSSAEVAGSGDGAGAAQWDKVFEERLPLVNQLLLRAEHYFADFDTAEEELAKALDFLHNESNKRQLKALAEQLERAVARGESALVQSIEKEYNAFLHNLTSSSPLFSYAKKQKVQQESEKVSQGKTKDQSRSQKEVG